MAEAATDVVAFCAVPVAAAVCAGAFVVPEVLTVAFWAAAVAVATPALTATLTCGVGADPVAVAVDASG
jgi:hypothetical protein